MITEDYVSFEIAKLLKEKEFDCECAALYDIKNGKFWENQTGYVFNNSQWENFIIAPTLQMAMKWLRLERGIAIIPIISSVLDNEKFLWDVEITVAETNKTYNQGWVYEIYEQACEAAIKYCLENLI